MLDNYCLFENQLQPICDEYINLKIKQKNSGLKYLKGTIDISDIDGNILYAFFIEIHYKEGFPKKFPELYEIGGFIPNDADWHKYSNDLCCVTVDPCESIYCRNGITIYTFIKEYVIPFLAHQYYRKIFGEYRAEYAHGYIGLAQAYEDIMKTSDRNVWIEYLKYALGGERPNIARNSTCTCGSGKKYKHCHLQVLEDLKAIGREDLLLHINKITGRL